MTGAALFDSHLHLTAPRFEDDRAAVLARARDAGVSELVTVGSDPEDARRAIEIAAASPGVWATVGLHPHAAARTSAAVLDSIERLAAGERVVALGETGLDYHYDNASRSTQCANFRAHMELAVSTGLPVVVHTREADEDTRDVIRDFSGRARGVLHCFSGGEALLDAAVDAGWFVSFSGLVTFVPEIAGRVERVPADRLLIETDAPYLAPAPKRGRRNEPAFLVHTCRRVAELRGWTVDEAASLTRENARAFYGVSEDRG